ncbi:MAG: endo alpha-1,4 polygalactosaminidase [Bryobacteraceae bacterium]|nr:endo alpha-1,4 polygalactosaminidase [Bryobacteraceae bacterium]
MRLRKFVCALAILIGFRTTIGAEVRRWAVCYSERERVQNFAPYDLLVLDSDSHPSLTQLQTGNKQLLAYISIGEVEYQREYFARTEPYRLEPNPYWAGSFLLDIRDARWTEEIIRRIAPRALAAGFNGFFLDTVDSSLDLELRDGKRYFGMTRAAVDLIRRLRIEFPGAVIALNRGYAIVPEVGRNVDYVLAESMHSTWDFDLKSYTRVDSDITKEQTLDLQKAMAANPALRILTLDYADPTDKNKLRQIYKFHRQNGFIPYVSTIELNRVIPEPGG